MAMWRRIKHQLKLRTRFRELKQASASLGVAGAALLSLQHVRQEFIKGNSLLSLRSREAKYPLWGRANTSDFEVFQQIFVDRQYMCMEVVPETGLVIDCGANVGYSSAYFLSRYPRCQVIAIEPDPANFELLRRNLAPYGSRAKLINAGVWSHPARLALVEMPYRDGREWARQVRECLPGEESGLPAVAIGNLLEESEWDRISLLKVDIEGAEAVVFSTNYEPWIDRVNCIVIELHDDSSFGPGSAIFAEAINGRGFSIAQRGELHVCQRGNS